MKEIKAKEGFYLTQSNEVDDRIFITAIIGKNVKESDWREVSQEEKDMWEALLEQAKSENI